MNEWLNLFLDLAFLSSKAPLSPSHTLSSNECSLHSLTLLSHLLFTFSTRKVSLQDLLYDLTYLFLLANFSMIIFFTSRQMHWLLPSKLSCACIMNSIPSFISSNILKAVIVKFFLCVSVFFGNSLDVKCPISCIFILFSWWWVFSRGLLCWSASSTSVGHVLCRNPTFALHFGDVTIKWVAFASPGS